MTTGRRRERASNPSERARPMGVTEPNRTDDPRGAASLRPSPRSLTRDGRVGERDSAATHFKSHRWWPYRTNTVRTRLMAVRRARVRLYDHYTSSVLTSRSIEGPTMMVPRVRSRTITRIPRPRSPCINYLSHPPRSIDRSIDRSIAASTRTTRRLTMMALTSQGFALAPTATRSALAPRGMWTLDAMTMAFVRSEGFDDAVDGVGEREATTTTTTKTPPRRDAGAIRDGDTRSG